MSFYTATSLLLFITALVLLAVSANKIKDHEERKDSSKQDKEI